MCIFVCVHVCAPYVRVKDREPGREATGRWEWGRKNDRGQRREDYIGTETHCYGAGARGGGMPRAMWLISCKTLGYATIEHQFPFSWTSMGLARQQCQII